MVWDSMRIPGRRPPHLGADKKKRKQGKVGRPKNPVKIAFKESAVEIMCRLKFNPVEELIMWARGDVVGLGLMTQAELDSKPRYVRAGTRMRWEPSGRERAVWMVKPEIRQRSADTLMQYGFVRQPRQLNVTSPDGSVSGSNVQIYLPDNGRETEQTK